jgi:hypothetical protein
MVAHSNTYSLETQSFESLKQLRGRAAGCEQRPTGFNRGKSPAAAVLSAEPKTPMSKVTFGLHR